MTTLFDDETQKQGGPIQWIGFDETLDKYHVYPNAVKYLKTLTRPLAIVSVVGLYRTGKSYLLNRILDVKEGNSFQVSPTIKSCTKGLWLMRPPIHLETHDLLVVDTEGLGSLSASTNHDTRVFSLALLLSSMFLYNSCGAINETSLNNLSLVSSIAKHIHVSSDNETNMNDLSSAFPRFLWVARDFSLQLVDDDGATIDSTSYFNNALTVSPNSDPDEAKNKVRNAINALFPTHKRNCVCMVRPCSDEAKLQALPDLEDSELRPEFLQTLTELKDIIFKHCLPMSVPGQEGLIITGPLLATLSETYVDCINSNKVPVIRDSWSLLSETECNRAAEKARKEWRLFTESIDESLTIPQIESLFDTTKQDLLKNFDSEAVGTYAPDAKKKLEEEMDSGIAIVIESCRLRWKDKIRGRLIKLEKKALREATNVGDLIQLFEDDVQDGEEEFWYPEAFPCLIHAVESFTIRLEKKVVELQRHVDSSDLEMAKAKAESETLVKNAQDTADKAMEEKITIQESLEQTQRELSDTKRRFEESERVMKNNADASSHALEELRNKLKEMEKESVQEQGGIDEKTAEEHAERVATLTKEMIEQKTELEHLRDENATLNKTKDDSSKEIESLMIDLAQLTPLASELEEYKSKHDEMKIALSSTENRMQELEDRHEEESQDIQKEAMETVTAIRQVLAKERERCQKQKEETEKTLQGVRVKAKKHAESLTDRAERAEELYRQRQTTIEENKRLNAKERDTLRAEIERYATMFKEHQEATNVNRKEWMAQLQDTQKLANDRERKMMDDKERFRRETDDTRRNLDMDLASTKAKLQSAERRRQTLEDEMKHVREKLGKSQSTGATAVRLQAEVSMLKEQKEKSQNETRTLSARIQMLERKLKETRRQCEMEKTKISMQYERQISVLESKLLS
jgi:hypothetical protein